MKKTGSSIMKWIALSLLSLYIFPFIGISQEEEGTQSDYIIEAYITNETPYVGEQIRYVVRYYAYTQSEDVFTELPEFIGFWLTDVFEALDGRVETIGNRQYIVREVFAEISPLETGPITILPASLDIQETVFRAAYILETEPITINVQPLPENQPDAFRGAVGAFNARIEVDPLQITLGEPVTLTMTIDGTGNLEQLSAPVLPETGNWRTYSNPSRYVVSSIGGLRFGQKVFEWLLIPEQAGTQIFPSITFAYFDPQINEYVTTNIDEFSISVLPGENGILELPTLNQNVDSVAILPLRTFTLGEVSTHTDSSISGILWFLAPGICLAGFGYVCGRQVQEKWRKAYLQRSALQNAQRSLKHLKKRDLLTIGQNVQQILNRYFIHRLAIEGKTLNTDEMQIIAREHACSPDVVSQIDQVNHLIEDVRFAPDVDEALIEQLVHDTMDLLTKMDKCLQ